LTVCLARFYSFSDKAICAKVVLDLRWSTDIAAGPAARRPQRRSTPGLLLGMFTAGNLFERFASLVYLRYQRHLFSV
jgi:hypothetical protein